MPLQRSSIFKLVVSERGGRGSNSRAGFTRPSGLANRPLHRLGYHPIHKKNVDKKSSCEENDGSSLEGKEIYVSNILIISNLWI